MSWFDEQLKYRKQIDNENFSDSMDAIAGAVMGRRSYAHNSGREPAQSAIDEILKYYHCKIRSDPLPKQADTLEEQLEFRFRPYGISFRRVLLDENWYRQATGPMLGTLKPGGSAVALIPGKLSGYTFFDAETGKRLRISRKTRELLEPEAICFYKPLPLRSLGIPDLMRFMIEQLSISDLMLYLGMMVLSTLLGLIPPLFTKWLFGDVLASGSTRVLLALAAFMVCFSISQIFFSCFQSLLTSRINIRLETAVQAAVMNRIMSLPASFFRGYASGELTQRAQYVQSLCSTVFNTIGITGLTSVLSLVYIGQIFAFAPALVIPSLLITLATIALSLITTFLQMRITKKQMLVSSKTGGMTYAMITGIQKIKLAGAEKRMFSRWARQYAQEAHLSYNPPVFLKLSGTVSMAISLIGSLILYYLAVRSGVTVANYYAFNASFGLVSGAFMSLSSIAAVIANIRPTLDMARPILEAEPEVIDGKEQITSLTGAIELSQVSFRYADDLPPVFDNLSLKVHPGEYLAVVGSTGCGKSTLLRLLLGFETPQKGSVFYDRKDISKVDLKSLRRKIGVVMQDGKLFLGDIYSNIVISAPQLTLKEAWEAAELASIAEDIRQMPMGMNTIIAEGQGGISGGQRQRLMIARALAPKPKILMFDEATSALDNVTQQKISDAIDSLSCTRIVIAHRLSTIRHCDRILVLDGGKIAEEGTYEELIEKNGLFADLVSRQRLEH